jgi:hypothetical protein
MHSAGALFHSLSQSWLGGSPHRLRAAGLVAAMLGALACSAAAAAPAGATTLCTGHQDETFAPGLTNTSQTTTFTVRRTFSTCLSLADPTITSGSASTTIIAPFSCQSALDSGSSTSTIHWSNGHTSTFSFTYTSITVNGTDQTEETGTITAGEFTGRSAIGVVTTPSLDPTACATSTGVTSLTGLSTLTIL